MNALEKAEKAEAYSSLTWEPAQISDKIYGIVIDLKLVQMKRGDEATLIKLDTIKVVEDGRDQPNAIWGVWVSAAIKRIIEDMKLCVGDEIALVFKGISPDPKMRGMKLYAASIEKTEHSKPYVELESSIPKPPPYETYKKAKSINDPELAERV